MEQCTKFTQINVKFTETSVVAHMFSIFVRTKFVRNLYEFRTNFVKFGNERSKHTSKHTLQSH